MYQFQLTNFKRSFRSFGSSLTSVLAAVLSIFTVEDAVDAVDALNALSELETEYDVLFGSGVEIELEMGCGVITDCDA